MIKPTDLKSNSAGLVSITVALIMMTIITLLVASFSLIARREQRLALDRRLSSQAYYAAETGVNKAKALIKNNSLVGNINTCGTAAAPTAVTPIDLGSGTETTCVLVDQTPDTISFDSVVTNSAKVTKIKAANGSVLRRIAFYWQSKDTPGVFSSSTGSFPQSASYSVLIKPPSSAFTRDDILSSTYTSYLYPLGASSQTPGTLSFADVNQGDIIQGRCAANGSPKECYAVINIDTTINATELYLALSSIYADARVDVQVIDINNGSPVRITGSQAVIDATGKSGDVLRRVQARVPLDNSWMVDNFAVSTGSGGICKQYKHNVSDGVVSERPAGCPLLFQ
jgi:hypothetical protein